MPTRDIFLPLYVRLAHAQVISLQHTHHDLKLTCAPCWQFYFDKVAALYMGREKNITLASLKKSKSADAATYKIGKGGIIDKKELS